MKKELLRKIFVILFIFNLIFVYLIKDITPVFAAGAYDEGDDLDDPPKPKPKPKPKPDPKPDPDSPEPPSPTPPSPTPPSPDPDPPTYSISGSVWEDVDVNKKGSLDMDDILISNINVKLCAENSSNSMSTTTDHNGNYIFSDLSSGKYTLEFTYNNDKYNGLFYKSSFSPNEFNGNSAVDSQDKRLELMQKFSDINYETLSNINNIDKSMIALSEVEITDNNIECNLPIMKRPQYSVKVTKNVSHLSIVLSDGSTLIDWDRASNPNPKYIMYLENNSLTAIMDDEITHGAIIKIKYAITVENTSEFDSLSYYFTEDYIERNKSLFTKEFNFDLLDSVPTKYYLYDYLGDNLIFDENDNDDNWNFVNTGDLLPHDANIDLSNLQVLVNTVILKSGESKTLTLNASKIMTIADTDLLTYDNYVEVVAYKSILGKLLTYDAESNKRKILTPGNLNIYDEERVQNLEPDEAKAETVTRVPPFGKDLSYYTTIIGIIVLAIEIAVLSTLKFKIKHLRNRYIMK